MKRITQRISPAGFERLKEKMLQAQLQGHDPTTCACIGLTHVGLQAQEGAEVAFVVDYDLDGPIFPFMDWPQGWVKDDPSTWR